MDDELRLTLDDWIVRSFRSGSTDVSFAAIHFVSWLCGDRRRRLRNPQPLRDFVGQSGFHRPKNERPRGEHAQHENTRAPPSRTRTQTYTNTARTHTFGRRVTQTRKQRQRHTHAHKHSVVKRERRMRGVVCRVVLDDDDAASGCARGMMMMVEVVIFSG